MKRISLRLLALLFTAILVLPLVGCGQTPPAEEEAPDETAEPAPEPLTVVADGTSVYQIVRPELCTQQLTDAAVALNRQIKAMTGVGLTITTDWENERISSTLAGEYEIVLGETTRNGKYFTYDTTDIGTYDYDITVIENRVLILGGSETATASAVEYFIEHCLPAAPTDTFELDPALHVEYRVPESDKMTVMSLNLLATDTEYAANANNNQHLIQVRQPRIREIILTHMPDSIGLQECSAPWRQYFDGMDASWSYDRTGASKNQKISILYNTDKLELVKSGSIWLTEDPEHLKVSVEWKGESERLAHYAVFKIKETGEHYVHVNTHVGTESTLLQTGQATVVRTYCEQLAEETGYPVVCTGDFNFTLESPSYTALTETLLRDTKFEAAESSTGTGSFNKMGKAGYPKAYPIDQVLVSADDWNVYTYAVDYTTFDGCYYSDHYAVVATMTMKE